MVCAENTQLWKSAPQAFKLTPDAQNVHTKKSSARTKTSLLLFLQSFFQTVIPKQCIKNETRQNAVSGFVALSRLAVRRITDVFEFAVTMQIFDSIPLALISLLPHVCDKVGDNSICIYYYIVTHKRDKKRAALIPIAVSNFH